MTSAERLIKILLLWCLLLPAGAGALAKPGQWEIRSMTISGCNAFKPSRLKKIMLTRASRFWARAYFRPVLFREDLNTLVLFYGHNGYLSSRITDTAVVLDTAARKADIRIHVDEGPLSHIEGVDISGNTAFPDSLLLARAAIRPGAAYSKKAMTETAESLLLFYHERGYINAAVRPEAVPRPGTALVKIRFAVEEGRPFTVGRVRISGAKKTRPGVIRRELSFRTRDTIRRSDLSGSQHRLYMTGLFKSVYVQPGPADSNGSAARDITVELEEKPSIELNASVGYGTVEKGRLKAEALNNNLFGTARKAGLKGKLSFIGYGAEASFTEPWTFGFRLRTDANLFWEYLEETGYTLTKTGGSLTLGRKFGDFVTISAGTRFENSYLKDIRLTELPDTLTAFVRSVLTTVNYDSRDDLFNTRQGVFAEYSHEFAGPFLSNTTLFSRSITRLKYFRSIGPGLVLASAAEIGWILDFSAQLKVQPNERFYTGGPNSLRGFDYRAVGPVDTNGVPLGGRLKAVFNVLEIRKTIYKIAGLAAFAELGNVWSSVGDFRLSDLRPCLGLGPRIDTPIGVIRADMAMNPYPRGDESALKFYLNVGQAF